MNTKGLVVWGGALVAIIVAAQLVTRGRAPSEELPAVVSQPAPPAPRAAPRDPAPTPPPGTADATADRAPEPTAAADAAAPARAPDGSRRFMFDCGNGVIFAVRTVPGEATLFSPQALGAEVITLPQIDAGRDARGRATQGAVAEAASGARYASGDVSFSSRGGLATFEIRGRTFADCTSSPGAAQTAEARRRGVTFRARGNEPAWLLEMSQERIELALELGTRRIDFPYREPTVSGARTTYRAFSGTQELLVVLDRVPCNDTMSGEAFETTVTVTFENRTLYGCGQAP
jgi:uncharacterized membrane protein